MEPLGPAAAAVQPRAAHDRPVVAFLGHTSKLRGFHQLPEIIDRCQSAGKGPRFLVQVQSRPAARAEDLGFVLDRLGAMPKADVSLVEGSLSTAQYFSLMAEADVVLLPYSPAFYGHCSSGVFAEAAAAGKVIVVPAGTVGARLGEEYGLGVVVAAGWNPKSLANAVGQAVNDLPRQRAKAMAAASRFGCEQGVASFWNQVLEAIPDPVLAAC
jgi:glycosyltransferase involved in cell wall biosynthesis